LFPRFWCSADRRVCAPRPAPATMEKPQTAEPAVCATRLFVLVLCFHRHLRFVRSAFEVTVLVVAQPGGSISSNWERGARGSP
jgi:hypothetical protein